MVVRFAPGIEDYVQAVSTGLGALARPGGLTLEQRRDRFDRLGALLRDPYPAGMEVWNRQIALPGREIPVRTYRPAGDGAQPCIFYFHGGGYVSGSIDSHDTITAQLAALTGATVISVHYRRPPENPYPAPNDDCWAALQWAIRRAEDLGIDPARLAVAGDSAGGNLAASCALRARGEGGPALRAQVLIYPGMCADLETTESYRTNRHDPFLNPDSMRFYRTSYLGGGLESPGEIATPLYAADHRGLPPAYVLVAEHDPVLDDGRLYAERLQAAGVETTFRMAPGMIHGFLRARRFAPGAQQELEALAAALRRYLAP